MLTRKTILVTLCIALITITGCSNHTLQDPKQVLSEESSWKPYTSQDGGIEFDAYDPKNDRPSYAASGKDCNDRFGAYFIDGHTVELGISATELRGCAEKPNNWLKPSSTVVFKNNELVFLNNETHEEIERLYRAH